ncbi:hypothetical protein RND81_04G208500 [Saponaria officinalis]|uniref:Pectinesterase n=1 Tax=Saponaria officinalis TaxID=3572 RepID=A0AAW1LPJ1_SAPOF
MAFKNHLISITILHIVLLFPLLSNSDPRKFCDNTPHSNFCKATLSKNKHDNGTIHGHSRFCVNQSLYITKQFNSVLKQHLRPSHTRSLSKTSIYALQDCRSLASLTLDYLSSTFRAINTTDFLSTIDTNQVQTMLSATITNLDTCFDGLLEAQPESNITQDLKNHIINNTMLYSVTLALFTKGWLSKPSHKRYTATEKLNFGNTRRLIQLGEMGIIINNMVVVNKNGSGNFTTINDAINIAPNNTKVNMGYFGIYVMGGVYEEYVVIPSNKMYLIMVGDGINQTIITGNHSVNAGWTTYNSATFAVTAAGFVAVNMTFQNTAGASMHQAVALRNGADLSAFYNCSFEGYQDTLYTHSMRQFYKQCDIFGTVDFIFGNAAVVFQDCNIYPRQPLKGQFNAITAQGRTDPNQNTGTSIHNCSITATNELISSNYMVKTYFGRPWKQNSLTIFMQSYVDSSIDPAGWHEWSGNFAIDTLYYAEYNNTGPGSDTSNRVTWPGYHVIDANDASNFTVSSFILGDFWLPSSGVPYSGGLI